jgi:hypothetical protein
MRALTVCVCLTMDVSLAIDGNHESAQLGKRRSGLGCLPSIKAWSMGGAVTAKLSALSARSPAPAQATRHHGKARQGSTTMERVIHPYTTRIDS